MGTILMFVGATDTTALTFEYGLVLLAKHPLIQEKVRSDLLTVLESDNIQKSDVLYDINLLSKVPSFRALIHEILRISCVTKIGFQHYILERDIVVNGYKIPRGSSVKCNIEYIHNYSKTENWRYDITQNGKEICLENWLKPIQAKDGRIEYKFYQNESFILFGHGKRDCVGRQLALKELRILIGYMLLNWNVKLLHPQQEILHRGGKGLSVASIEPQIPVMIEKI